MVHGINQGDYHRDMSIEVYKTWFIRLTANPKTACDSNGVLLVLNNAPYNSKTLDRIPTLADTRNIIVAFLQHEFRLGPT